MVGAPDASGAPGAHTPPRCDVVHFVDATAEALYPLLAQRQLLALSHTLLVLHVVSPILWRLMRDGLPLASRELSVSLQMERAALRAVPTCTAARGADIHVPPRQCMLHAPPREGSEQRALADARPWAPQLMSYSGYMREWLRRHGPTPNRHAPIDAPPPLLAAIGTRTHRRVGRRPSADPATIASGRHRHAAQRDAEQPSRMRRVPAESGETRAPPTGPPTGRRVRIVIGLDWWSPAEVALVCNAVTLLQERWSARAAAVPTARLQVGADHLPLEAAHLPLEIHFAARLASLGPRGSSGLVAEWPLSAGRADAATAGAQGAAGEHQGTATAYDGPQVVQAHATANGWRMRWHMHERATRWTELVSPEGGDVGTAGLPAARQDSWSVTRGAGPSWHKRAASKQPSTSSPLHAPHFLPASAPTAPPLLLLPLLSSTAPLDVSLALHYGLPLLSLAAGGVPARLTSSDSSRGPALANASAVGLADKMDRALRESLSPAAQALPMATPMLRVVDELDWWSKWYATVAPASASEAVASTSEAAAHEDEAAAHEDEAAAHEDEAAATASETGAEHRREHDDSVSEIHASEVLASARRARKPAATPSTRAMHAAAVAARSTSIALIHHFPAASRSVQLQQRLAVEGALVAAERAAATAKVASPAASNVQLLLAAPAAARACGVAIEPLETITPKLTAWTVVRVPRVALEGCGGKEHATRPRSPLTIRAVLAHVVPRLTGNSVLLLDASTALCERALSALLRAAPASCALPSVRCPVLVPAERLWPASTGIAAARPRTPASLLALPLGDSLALAALQHPQPALALWPVAVLRRLHKMESAGQAMHHERCADLHAQLLVRASLLGTVVEPVPAVLADAPAVSRGGLVDARVEHGSMSALRPLLARRFAATDVQATPGSSSDAIRGGEDDPVTSNARDAVSPGATDSDSVDSAGAIEVVGGPSGNLNLVEMLQALQSLLN